MSPNCFEFWRLCDWIYRIRHKLCVALTAHQASIQKQAVVRRNSISKSFLSGSCGPIESLDGARGMGEFMKTAGGGSGLADIVSALGNSAGLVKLMKATEGTEDLIKLTNAMGDASGLNIMFELVGGSGPLTKLNEVIGGSDGIATILPLFGGTDGGINLVKDKLKMQISIYGLVKIIATRGDGKSAGLAKILNNNKI